MDVLLKKELFLISAFKIQKSNNKSQISQKRGNGYSPVDMIFPVMCSITEIVQQGTIQAVSN